MPLQENRVSCDFLACEQALHLDERSEPHEHEFKREEAIIEKKIHYTLLGNCPATPPLNINTYFSLMEG